MGLSKGGFAAVEVVAVLSSPIWGFLLWTAIHRGLVRFLTQFTAYLYVRVSKAVSSSFRSTSELPHSEVHRRRDLIGASTIVHKYPGVIPSYNSRSERILNKYGRHLNVYANVTNTNATIFRVRSWLRECDRITTGKTAIRIVSHLMKTAVAVHYGSSI